MKILLTGLYSVVLLFSLTACSEEEKPVEDVVRPIRVVTLEEPKSLEEAMIPGRVRAAHSVDLSFRVQGRLANRLVNVGDSVQRGGIIARLDPNDFELAILKSQSQLDQEKAARARAEGEYLRELNIFKQDSGATSKAVVARKKEAMDMANAGIESGEAALAMANNQLSYTVLRSPLDAKVVATHVEDFEAVAAGQIIARLLDNSQLKFDISVPEQSIAYVQHVSSAHVTFDAFPKQKIPAKISEVGREASSTTRTYTVTLVMDQPEGIEILAGMAGMAAFTFDKADNPQGNEEIIIPVSSVFSQQRGQDSAVWVFDPEKMTVSSRKIKTGRLSEQGIVVTEGLSAGEVIATAGVHFLKEGVRVRLLDTSSTESTNEGAPQ